MGIPPPKMPGGDTWNRFVVYRNCISAPLIPGCKNFLEIISGMYDLNYKKI